MGGGTNTIYPVYHQIPKTHLGNLCVLPLQFWVLQRFMSPKENTFVRDKRIPRGWGKNP